MSSFRRGQGRVPSGRRRAEHLQIGWRWNWRSFRSRSTATDEPLVTFAFARSAQRAVGRRVERRIDAYLVCGASITTSTSPASNCCKLLAEDEHIRVQVAEHFGDIPAITAADFLVTYTCDVRPSTEEQVAIRNWVDRGGRWLALHGTNCTLDPPTGSDGGLYSAPRALPVWADTLGSQFVSHPPIAPYAVNRSPGAANSDPLVAGIDSFESKRRAVPDGASWRPDSVARDPLDGLDTRIR